MKMLLNSNVHYTNMIEAINLLVKQSCLLEESLTRKGQDLQDDIDFSKKIIVNATTIINNLDARILNYVNLFALKVLGELDDTMRNTLSNNDYAAIAGLIEIEDIINHFAGTPITLNIDEESIFDIRESFNYDLSTLTKTKATHDKEASQELGEIEHLINMHRTLLEDYMSTLKESLVITQ
ncbi:MAG: hypothetical protein KAH32_03440 [Chlamydiia bacterium]|nr:hypothetical protein [Chlamydiia bacterium]